MFLLDTNVVSEIRKIGAGRADATFTYWASSFDGSAAFISVITLHELEHGVLLVERRDPQGAGPLRQWLDVDVHDAFTDRVLSLDSTVAKVAAALHVPDPAPINDAYLAATALAHNLTMVTRNVADFDRFEGLDVLNPWERP
jgi:predicted nucleic acid-binding protein